MIVHLAKRELRDDRDLFFLVIPFPQPLRGRPPFGRGEGLPSVTRKKGIITSPTVAAQQQGTVR